MGIKDDIRDVLTGDVIPLLRDEVWPDTYDVVAATPTPDGAGGFTTVASVVESGLCFLQPAGRQGVERATADKLGWSSAYAIDLPLTTVCTPAHTLTVNGRALEVGEVLRGGNFAYKAVAVVREQG